MEVVVAAVVIVVDIVAIVAGIAVAADSNNMAEAIAPCIEAALVDDSIHTVEAPVVVDNIDTDFVDIAKHMVDIAKHAADIVDKRAEVDKYDMVV